MEPLILKIFCTTITHSCKKYFTIVLYTNCFFKFFFLTITISLFLSTVRYARHFFFKAWFFYTKREWNVIIKFEIKGPRVACLDFGMVGRKLILRKSCPVQHHLDGKLGYRVVFWQSRSYFLLMNRLRRNYVHATTDL